MVRSPGTWDLGVWQFEERSNPQDLELPISQFQPLGPYETLTKGVFRNSVLAYKETIVY